jgi:choline dehydrogenase
VSFVEAGRRDGTDAMSVPAKWLTLLDSDVDWGFRTVPQAGLDGAVLGYPRGRVLGGSSGINAMMHLRADRTSYDRWGADGWGFDDLLPYFRRAENAVGRDPHFRGTDGPLTVEPNVNPHPAAEAFFAACRERGYPVSADLNGFHTEGVCWFDQNIVDGKRQSAADGICGPRWPAQSHRPHRRRRHRSVVRGHQVHQVRYRQGISGELTVDAEREVIVRRSRRLPHLLLLSGVGPRISFATTASMSSQTCRALAPTCPTIRSTWSPTPHLADDAWRAQHRRRGGRVPRGPPRRPPTRTFSFAVPFTPPAARPRNGYAIAYSMLRPTAAGRYGWPLRTPSRHR